ncbi:MAG: hypothetical protein ABSG70_17225 [Terriglobales bacterium]
MASSPEEERWRALAEQTSKEMDNGKLMILVQQLCNALDERHLPASEKYNVVKPGPVHSSEGPRL